MSIFLLVAAHLATYRHKYLQSKINLIGWEETCTSLQGHWASAICYDEIAVH